MKEAIRNIFIEETTQQLNSLGLLLKDFFNGNDNDSIVEKVFLAMHSIKGAGPMVGFNYLPDVVIPVEKTYARIRKGELDISEELMEKTDGIIKLLINVLKSNSDNHLNNDLSHLELLNFFKNLNS